MTKKLIAVMLTVAVSVCSVLGVFTGSVSASEYASVDLAKTVSGGAYHSGAIKSDGSLWIWGNNGYYQLGLGIEDRSHSQLTPACVFESGMAQISLGGFHSMAINEDGELYGWGQNTYGQVGNDSHIDCSTPVYVMDDVVAVSSGFMHTLAIKSDGTLWAWGRNNYGQLGTGAWLDQLTPVQIMEDVVAVSAGSYHNLALKSDGTLWAWGYNLYGQLGNGTTQITNTPIQIMEGYDIDSFSCGNAHSGVVTTDGTLYMFGQNTNHQIGIDNQNGTYTAVTSPVEILTNVKQIQCGNVHTLAITNDNDLYVWGSNTRTQCMPEEGASYEINEPTYYMSNVDYITPGADFNLYVINGTELWGYGWNFEGELGCGDRVNHNACMFIFDGLFDHSVTEEPDPGILMGDVNGDGTVSAQDALLVLRYSMEIMDLTEDQLAAADVNADGSVDSADAIMILRSCI